MRRKRPRRGSQTILTASALCVYACACASGPSDPAPRRAAAVTTAGASRAPRAPARGGARGEPEPASEPLVQITDARFAAIDAAVAEAIAAHQLPGCVVVVGRSDAILHRRAYGMRSVSPTTAAMTLDTLFDLASLTKAVATTSSVMVLVERGALRLDDSVARHLPAFAQSGKERVTIEDLLLHVGGLPHANPLAEYDQGPERALASIYALAPRSPPGTSFVYSDLGFIVLAEVVRAVSHQSLDAFAAENVFGPLGMTESTFRPRGALRERAAPTEIGAHRDGGMIRGEVHDPRAFRLGGVAGNAGLFSTARDLSIFAQALLRGGVHDRGRFLSASTIATMTEPHRTSGGVRGLGWDMRSGYSVDRGELFSSRAFGHSGFTGTSLWIDPELDLFVLLLSNRVHPDGHGQANPLAKRIGTLAVSALRCAGEDARPHVRTGIDVLARDGFRALAGRRVGLVTNASARAGDGRRTIDVLASARGVDLVSILTPEHGLDARREGRVGEARDPASGRVVHSLFGATRKPTADMLRGIDTLVIDLQDAGTRFYTYGSTLHACLEAAAERHVRVVVLDRPNPLGGMRVEGPVLDASRRSFVNHASLPVRHGLTMGELARWLVAEERIRVELQVIDMEGWRRDLYFDDTGLEWTPPSPNLKTAAETITYPAIGMLEGTNLSVGRGTETPFELFGAPWLDARALVMRLRAAHLAGVTFTAVRFTPSAAPYRDRPCAGVRVRVIDRDAFEPVRVALEIAGALLAQHPRDWRVDDLIELLGHRAAFEALRAARPYNAIERLWQPALDDFTRARRPHLSPPYTRTCIPGSTRAPRQGG